ncbi:MAG: MotA/TolQ/ExbB proton channel family protein [Rhodocyclaceae bacterium]|nr:MotA/TolQ/ExbB proton channel family protein [Rhodocyclaceae bacterium]
MVEAAGWPIWPMIAASVVALAIIFERLFSLRAAVVSPAGILERAIACGRSGSGLEALEKTPLGRVLGAGIRNRDGSPEDMKQAVEETGRAVAHDLSRYLTTLGSIASMAPYLGLFGTVVGMIEIFAAQSPTSGADPAQLAHGISVALYNTAFGLIVAIPSMVFYRHFRARIDAYLVDMEQQAIHLVDAINKGRAA